MGLKNRFYKRALDKLLNGKKTAIEKEIKINPSQKILILFEGTDNSNRKAVNEFSNNLKNVGKTVKLLSYIDSKGEMTDFGMAVYNNNSINWYGFPKKHILDLLESQKFDILINLNPMDKDHLHALACKADADFKISLTTGKRHDFTLTINIKEKKNIKNILDQMISYLDTLSF